MTARLEPVDISAFASSQLALLADELAAEIAETSTLVAAHSPTALQRGGLALTNLVVSAQRTGLGGKTVLELGPDPAVTNDLPEHGIRTGDIVLVAEQPAASAKKREVREMEKKGAKGVVTRVGVGVVGVALDEDREDAALAGLGGRVWIVKLADDVTYRRMNGAMERLGKMSEGERSVFIRVLFGESSPTPVARDLKADEEWGRIEWVDERLNESQKEAIRFALASREIALIHGPPGVRRTICFCTRLRYG